MQKQLYNTQKEMYKKQNKNITDPL